MAEPPTLPGLPGLRWTHGESGAGYDPDDDALTLTAAAGVDWSNDALGVDANHRATLLGFDAPADTPDAVRAAYVAFLTARLGTRQWLPGVAP
jgi:hypothetical protein